LPGAFSALFVRLNHSGAFALMTRWTVLADRSVLAVSGEDAASFLQGLVTNDVERLDAGEARFAALLTPQGKILFDFFIYRAPAGQGAAFFIDCPTGVAADLSKRLGFYKLRAKVAIADVTREKAVAVSWGGEPDGLEGFIFADPRDARLGFRAIAPRSATTAQAPSDPSLYEAHRIAIGAPKGGVDFPYGDVFPHDVNMDLLNGVDFAKGCYVGQEVVSRMRHRGGVRKRIVKVSMAATAPAAGVAILAGEAPIGSVGSSAGSEGLAFVRLDRLADAESAGQALTADGVGLTVVKNDKIFS
jgi:tRNA-modifying protein YgfZ